MLKLKLFTCIFFWLVLCVLIGCQVNASSDNLLISQVQLGSEVSARHEFIEIYNNSFENIEITNWCLNYLTSSFTHYRLGCFNPDAEDTYLYLPAFSFALATSRDLLEYNPVFLNDLTFSSRLSGAAGYINVTDSVDNIVDEVGWGDVSIDNRLIASPEPPMILSRKTLNDNYLQDTDITADDFELILPRLEYSSGSIYEVRDYCLNLEGVQAEVPIGYDYVDGICSEMVVDVCPNIDGVQAILPDGYYVDENLDCASNDICYNLPEIQSELPEGYILTDENECTEKALPLLISEMLPNVVGLDDDNEFIELYNPNESDINLINYSIVVNDKNYNLSDEDNLLVAGGYLAVYNSEINFTLLNSTSSVYIKSNDETYIGDIITYDSPKEGETWAFIDGTWQYTNRPTPNQDNLPYLEIERDIVTTIKTATLKPCGPGQYRNPETNRCRNIESSTTSLTPCKEGYERNPETNRCRKIESVLGDSDLVPCKEGYERNPETNRCRKIVSSDIPSADYKVEEFSRQSNNDILTGSIIGIGSLAVGYGVWEWRKDLLKLFVKIKNFYRKGK